MAVLYLLLLLLGLRASGKLLQWLKKPRKPDAVPGLPLLGNALALGRHGAPDLVACRQKFGDVFTLSLANQKMMFWFEPHLIRQFFEAPDTQISFRPAVEQFTQRVFGLPSKTFFPKHPQVLDVLRGLSEPTALATYAAELAVSCNKRLDKLLPCGEQVELYVAIRRLVFGSAVEVLFGSKCLSAGNGQPSELEVEAAFHDFEAGFEMAASPIPHLLQPRFVTARGTLLSWFSHCHSEGLFEGTKVGELCEKSGLPTELYPNLLLAVLWTSQANTVAATFWAFAFLLLPQHASIKQEILTELQHVSLSNDQQQRLDVSHYGDVSAQQNHEKPGISLSARAVAKALDRRSAASLAALEAIRLRAQGIVVRMASSDFTIATATGQKVFVNKGCVLAVNPYLSHLDNNIYKGVDPAVFDPSRPIMDVGGGSVIVPSLAGLAFGAGTFRCLGRFFAQMEVALFVQLLLSQRSMTLQPGPPEATESPELTHDNAAGSSWAASTLQWLFGEAAVEWGLGSRLDGRDQDNSNSCLRHSGDPDGLLPPPDLKKLVGVKVPSTPCYVHVGPVR